MSSLHPFLGASIVLSDQRTEPLLPCAQILDLAVEVKRASGPAGCVPPLAV